ncbi:hypothetical protein R1flu_012102 [Riccia fluitans]|uniref:Uncharacterized protein n=1 Tax=Riccia fluitans TaxID=41844 RepID=A0ABD1Z9W0_9MARC
MACRSLGLNSPVGSVVAECQACVPRSVGKRMSCDCLLVRSASAGGFEKAVLRSQRAVRSKGIESQKLLRSKSRGETFVLPTASSPSPWVENDDAGTATDDAVFEGSPEGSVSIDGDTRTELMNEVMRRLSEEDLEEAAKKYNYEDELFAQIDFAQINTFTKKPFRGNPAAVCYLPYERSDEWLKLIAKEFNLPATAFVIKRRQTGKSRLVESEGSALITADETGADLKPVKRIGRSVENEFDIRWFTTNAELELCGHATLASAHMLFSSGLVEGDTIIFHSKKGTLRASKVAGYDDDPEEPSVDSGDGEADGEAKVPYPKTVELGKGVVELDFPLSKAAKVDGAEAGKVSDALGVTKAEWVGRTDIGDYLVELPFSKDVELLQPNFQKIKELGGRGVIVTARAPAYSEFDVVSRFFAPNLGISEDPVTGSAHTTLGPYWATKLGKYTLEAYQASERGGQITLRVDEGADRVYLQGGAVLVMAGTLLNTFSG